LTYGHIERNGENVFTRPLGRHFKAYLVIGWGLIIDGKKELENNSIRSILHLSLTAEVPFGLVFAD